MRRPDQHNKSKEVKHQTLGKRAFPIRPSSTSLPSLMCDGSTEEEKAMVLRRAKISRVRSDIFYAETHPLQTPQKELKSIFFLLIISILPRQYHQDFTVLRFDIRTRMPCCFPLYFKSFHWRHDPIYSSYLTTVRVLAGICRQFSYLLCIDPFSMPRTCIYQHAIFNLIWWDHLSMEACSSKLNHRQASVRQGRYIRYFVAAMQSPRDT